jgi:tRNA-specific 2-thiouridylase
VADNDYRRFIQKRKPELETQLADGDIVHEGNIVGKHRGFPYYTIGQRSGIGAHRERMYVTEIDPHLNRVVIGHPDALLHRGLIATNLNLISATKLEPGVRVEAQVRYKDTPASATVYPEGDNRFRIHFDEPKRAITPGQSVVMYKADRLFGGGVIERLTE